MQEIEENALNKPNVDSKRKKNQIYLKTIK